MNERFEKAPPADAPLGASGFAITALPIDHAIARGYLALARFQALSKTQSGHLPA
jgi:endonuclease/exonuclease/phosphatase (EEP) superfamily protein YafD